MILILCDFGETVDDSVMKLLLFTLLINFMSIRFFFLSSPSNNTILQSLSQFTFYLMPLQEQKLLTMVIFPLQNGAKIQMGPFSQLNYEFATNVNIKQLQKYFLHQENHEQFLCFLSFFRLQKLFTNC